MLLVLNEYNVVMSDLTEKIQPITELLLESDETQLFTQLGLRAKAIAQDTRKTSDFDLKVIYVEAEMGVLDDIINFGKSIFKRLNIVAYNLICGSDADMQKEREELVKSIGLSLATATATLSALLVTHIGLAPAIATVVATLVIKSFYRPGLDELCQRWKDSFNNE